MTNHLMKVHGWQKEIAEIKVPKYKFSEVLIMQKEEDLSSLKKTNTPDHQDSDVYVNNELTE